MSARPDIGPAGTRGWFESPEGVIEAEIRKRAALLLDKPRAAPRRSGAARRRRPDRRRGAGPRGGGGRRGHRPGQPPAPAAVRTIRMAAKAPEKTTADLCIPKER